MTARREALTFQLHKLEETGSTNDEAKVLAQNGALAGTVVLAKRQTAGRGRGGNSWDSRNDGLYMSLVLRPKGGLTEAALLPVITAVAVLRGLRVVLLECCPFEKDDLLIKWPNDILLGGRKVCGILVETSFSGKDVDFAVAGIGINVNQTTLAPEISGKATSLRLYTDIAFDCEVVAGRVLSALNEVYVSAFADVLTFYRQNCVNIGRSVVVHSAAGCFAGMALGLTDTGELVVRTAKGRDVTVRAGEVSVRGVHGYSE